MITNLTLKFGSVTGQAPASISPTSITVFVGPNNSGKSRFLSELGQFCAQGIRDQNFVILQDVVFAAIDDRYIDDEMKLFEVPPNPGETLHPGHLFLESRQGGRIQVVQDQLRGAIRDPINRTQQYCSWFLNHRLLMLSGPTRTNLVNPQPAGSLQSPISHNSFEYLFKHNIRRQEVRDVLKKAFDKYFVLDPTTNLGQLQARLSARAPADEQEERGLHDAAAAFHGRAEPIGTLSDGVKAFAGMISEIYGGDPKIVLVDEPEAFLHPSLAMLLGQEITRGALQTGKKIFTATHSPNFVMGCIQSGAPINIVRLTYRDGVPTARMLPSDDILKLMRNPLLRSTGVLNGLFYELVVVTEGDTDRAFYQEINERLLRFKPEWGIPNCLFLNAQNKQTEKIIIEPLRKLGIPAAGIVDVDVLKEGGTNWNSLLGSATVPRITRDSMAVARGNLKAAMDATGRDMKRDGGLSILQGDELNAAEQLVDELEDYGIFIVRGGEIETWLQTLGCTGHGSEWLIKMFEKLGEDFDHPDYVKPSEGDVWKFMFRIRRWLMNPQRKGIPS